jgi:hypothetical protein
MHNTHLDTDGLQADVMRFMAIIAFCLIAILALVKNLDPPNSEAEVPVIPPVAETGPVQPEPVIATADETTGEVPAVDTNTEAELVETEEIEVSQQEPLADTPIEEEKERSLRLRFSSEAAFLSLIAGNGIQLYGLGDGEFTGMAPNFTITSAKPSGDLYELLPGSVPRKLVNIFERESTQVTYLVALSDDTRRELDQLLRRINAGGSRNANDKAQANGTLVIHRDGHVSHEI